MLYPRKIKTYDRTYFLLGPRGTGKSSFLLKSYPDAFRVDLPESYNYDTRTAITGDFNNDGKPNVVLGNSGPFQIGSGENINGKNQIYLGDGKGGFTVSKVSDDEGRTSAVAAHDLNGDGNLDLLFGRISQPILIFYGNGTGGFGRAENLEDVGYYTYALRIKDLDGDGIVDLIAGNADHASRIYFGK